ncbi:MAG: hypothetical protein O3B04_03725 [Chloroflexi bacterium]|nr:hypothetical protein [Chloroflexota bacterium]
MPLEFIIQYTVKDGADDEAKATRDNFFAALRAQNSDRYRYRSLAKPDGKSFVHLAWFQDELAFKEFQSLPEFPIFGKALGAACAVGPEALAITEINSSVTG